MEWFSLLSYFLLFVHKIDYSLTPYPYLPDPEGWTHPAFLAGQGLQHRQGPWVPVSVADLEEAAPGGLPAGEMELTTGPAGLLHWGLAPPWQRWVCICSNTGRELSKFKWSRVRTYASTCTLLMYVDHLGVSYAYTLNWRKISFLQFLKFSSYTPTGQSHSLWPTVVSHGSELNMRPVWHLQQRVTVHIIHQIVVAFMCPH